MARRGAWVLVTLSVLFKIVLPAYVPDYETTELYNFNDLRAVKLILKWILKFSFSPCRIAANDLPSLYLDDKALKALFTWQSAIKYF